MLLVRRKMSQGESVSDSLGRRRGCTSKSAKCWNKDSLCSSVFIKLIYYIDIHILCNLSQL